MDLPLELSEHNTEIPQDFYLTCNGQLYDGVSSQLVSSYRSLGLLPRRPIEIHHNTQNRKIALECGDIYFHINDLVVMASNLISDSFANRMQSHIEVFLSHIIAWNNAQTIKLTDNSTSSEFHLAQQNLNRADDAMALATVLSSYDNILSNTIISFNCPTLLYQLSSSTLKLEKALRKAFTSKTPSLQIKKNMDTIWNQLNVVKSEANIGLLYSLTTLNEFVLAQAYANKSLNMVHKLHAEDRSDLDFIIFGILAKIGAQTNNINLLIDSLNSALSTFAKKTINSEEWEKLTEISYTCRQAGRYFEAEGRIDLAIKYNLEAYRFREDEDSKDVIKEHLTSLTGKYSIQLANLADTPQLKVVFDQVKRYEKDSRFDLYCTEPEIAALLKSHFEKKGIPAQFLKNSKTTLAVIVNQKLDLAVFSAILSKIRDIAEKKLRPKELSLNTQTKPEARIIPDSTQIIVEGKSGQHPKTATKKSKAPKAAKDQQNDNRWQFFVAEPTKLTAIEFPKSQLIFNPDALNGVVTLRVRGTTGTWFACLNPYIIDELEKLKVGEGKKLLQKFLDNLEFGNDFAVPCFKEMELKSKQLGIPHSYIFKIRLLAKEGMGNVRIYAEVIEEVGDKKLVAFTAINPNSHAKHTRPIHFDMPQLMIENSQLAPG